MSANTLKKNSYDAQNLVNSTGSPKCRVVLYMERGLRVMNKFSIYVQTGKSLNTIKVKIERCWN